MQKIIFGITSLSLGGAERVLVDLANELSLKYDVTIFALYGKGEFEEELNNRVHLIKMYEESYSELTKIEKIKISLKILWNKKSIYKKYLNNNYDVKIAFLEGPITRLFSIKNKERKKVAWVHNDIGQVFGKNLKSKIKIRIDKKCYSNYNDIVFVSEDNKKEFEKIYNLNNNRIVIQNYISSERVLEKSKQDFENIFEKEKINFLTVARLTNQKAIDRLIKVHSKLIKDGFDHNFFVIGDGPEKEKLKEMIKLYDVEKTFKLLGKKNNPYPYIKHCNIFALLSYFEGYGMVLEEAKILNKPIIITNTAARESVSTYKKSYIVDNTEEGIYKGIKNSIKLLEEWKYEKNVTYLENCSIIKQIEKLVGK